MPSFPSLSRLDGILIGEYILSGLSKELQSAGEPVNTPAYRFTGFRKWFNADGYPAVAPPWGTLNAIGGAQYVVVYATGGRGGRGTTSGGIYVAFALPRGSKK